MVKLMGVLMVILTLLRLLSGAWIIYGDAYVLDRFPLAVYISAGITVALGIGYGIKALFRRINAGDLRWYFCLNGLCVLFGLLSYKTMFRGELRGLDFLFLGTALDVLLMLFIPFLLPSGRD